jgi:primosomal protein N' (replication factor Y)
MLLLNRRGFSTHIHCPRCGTVENCISCQVSLTFHQEDGTLLCHYCNYQKPVPDICSNCQTPVLRFAGFGTEKVESEVAARWPQARIARMDADSVRKKGSHEVILKAFRDRQIDILIGTQMIAKGFDFPHVTLVGVILADVGLMLPDFRSSERTFQLLTQVAGRAGRGEKPGRVIIQTFSPDHPSVRFAKNHDYQSFYRFELPARSEHGYPPYNRLINFIVRAREEKKAYLFARDLRDALKQSFAELEIIGPAPLPFYKLRGHYRWHVMIKAGRKAFILNQLWPVLAQLKKPSGAAMAVDVDPLNIL